MRMQNLLIQSNIGEINTYFSWRYIFDPGEGLANFSFTPARASGKRRPTFVPFGGLLVSMRKRQYRYLAEMRTADLKADR